MTSPQVINDSASSAIPGHPMADPLKPTLHRLGHRPDRDSVFAISWITGISSDCASVTQTWCEFTGRSAEQSIGQGWLRCIHPLDMPWVQLILHKHHHTQQAISLEYRLRRADGSFGWVQHNGIPQYDATEHFQGFVHVAIDIVGIKRLEQSLLEKQAELHKHRELAQCLLDIMTVVNMRQSVKATVDFILDQSVRMLHAHIGIVFRMGLDQRHMYAESALGLSASIAQLLDVMIGEGTAGRAAQQRRAVALDAIEIEALERILFDKPAIWESVLSLTQNVARSLAVPIIVHGNLLGVLAVYRRESSTFSTEDINLLSALGVQTGLVIQSNVAKPMIGLQELLEAPSSIVSQLVAVPATA